MRIISGNTKELHMISDHGDILHNGVIRVHVIRVNRRHGSNRRGMRGVVEE